MPFSILPRLANPCLVPSRRIHTRSWYMKNSPLTFYHELHYQALGEGVSELWMTQGVSELWMTHTCSGNRCHDSLRLVPSSQYSQSRRPQPVRSAARETTTCHRHAARAPRSPTRPLSRCLVNDIVIYCRSITYLFSLDSTSRALLQKTPRIKSTPKFKKSKSQRLDAPPFLPSFVSARTPTDPFTVCADVPSASCISNKPSLFPSPAPPIISGLIMVAIKSLDAYVDWTAQSGIQSPLGLRSTRDGQYRYTTASRPIAPGDTILRVPISSCLTAENLEALAERLKYESDAGARSKFELYINMLPSFEELRVLPRFWEGNLVETVTDGGQLESRIRRDKNDNLDPWALACVDSRANFLQDCYSMTPFLDM